MKNSHLSSDAIELFRFGMCQELVLEFGVRTAEMIKHLMTVIFASWMNLINVPFTCAAKKLRPKCTSTLDKPCRTSFS